MNINYIVHLRPCNASDHEPLLWCRLPTASALHDSHSCIGWWLSSSLAFGLFFPMQNRFTHTQPQPKSSKFKMHRVRRTKRETNTEINISQNESKSKKWEFRMRIQALNRVSEKCGAANYYYINWRAGKKTATSRMRWKNSIWKMAINANATERCRQMNRKCNVHVECKGSHRNHHLRFAAHNCKLSCPNSTLFSAAFFSFVVHSLLTIHLLLFAFIIFDNNNCNLVFVWFSSRRSPSSLQMPHAFRWGRNREGRKGTMRSDRTPFEQTVRKWLHISTLKCHFICILWICGRTIVQSFRHILEFGKDGVNFDLNVSW